MPSEAPVKIAVVGCGYVADLYAKTLHGHPNLNLIGAYDRNASNLATFCRRWSARAYASFAELVADPGTELVLNLTNPRSHREITQDCLEAGKHVYSEKPLAMTYSAAQELVALAERKNLYLASAPCSLLGETAQTIWRALNEGAIGPVRLAYGNFDDGMVTLKGEPNLWTYEAGIPMPVKDELEVGCTYEHAGYLLTWLAAFFGPARAVTSFASCQIPDKGIFVEKMAPDFSVGSVEYDDGVVARVTCSIVAPTDKSLTIVGDDGVLEVANVRHDASPVYSRPVPAMGRRGGAERRLNLFREWLEGKMNWILWSGHEWHFRKKLPFARKPSSLFASEAKRVDFCRGPSELAAAIRGSRPCRLSARLGLHITELIEAVQYPERFDRRRPIESKFEPIQPLPWI